MRSRLAAVALTSAALLAAGRASAADLFEIQVYTGDADAPGHLGLEVHANYTFRGHATPDYPGQIPPDRAGRITLEPSYGVTDWLEVGAYVQTFTAPGSGGAWGGAKLRTKLVVPERVRGRWLLGVNLEVGRVPTSVESQGWANEIRPILGWTDGTWLVAVNPIFGYALSGPDRFRIDLEPAGKVAWNTGHGYSLGVEYYASLGFANDLLPVRAQEHLVFATYDRAEPRDSPAGGWELNVGVGAGLTDATPQRLIAKLIVGREF